MVGGKVQRLQFFCGVGSKCRLEDFPETRNGRSERDHALQGHVRLVSDLIERANHRRHVLETFPHALRGIGGLPDEIGGKLRRVTEGLEALRGVHHLAESGIGDAHVIRDGPEFFEMGGGFVCAAHDGREPILQVVNPDGCGCGGSSDPDGGLDGAGCKPSLGVQFRPLVGKSGQPRPVDLHSLNVPLQFLRFQPSHVAPLPPGGGVSAKVCGDGCAAVGHGSGKEAGDLILGVCSCFRDVCGAGARNVALVKHHAVQLFPKIRERHFVQGIAAGSGIASGDKVEVLSEDGGGVDGWSASVVFFCTLDGTTRAAF